MMRLVTGEPMGTPTTYLSELNKSLSVHKLVALLTLIMVNKAINTSKPSYLAKRLKIREEEWGIIPVPLNSNQVWICHKRNSAST